MPGGERLAERWLLWLLHGLVGYVVMVEKDSYESYFVVAEYASEY